MMSFAKSGINAKDGVISPKRSHTTIATMVKGSATMGNILLGFGFVTGLITIFIALMKMASKDGEIDG